MNDVLEMVREVEQSLIQLEAAKRRADESLAKLHAVLNARAANADTAE